jgi:hypothetical protein
MSRKDPTQLIKYSFIAGMMLVCFLAGRASIGDKLFWKGYDAAMNHVSSTIKARAVEQNSFYMADLGIKFIPKGNNILGISYLGNAAADHADVVHLAAAKR